MVKAEGATRSTCGAVELLATIFSVDSDELKRRYGLLPRRQPCPECGEVADLHYRGYCSRECWRQSRLVWLVCDNCGRLFRSRYDRRVVHQIGKRGQQHVFCGKRCVGQWVGCHYGFAAHPENAKQANALRKWDYEEVWRLREAGMKVKEISACLGVPEITVYHILKRKTSNGNAQSPFKPIANSAKPDTENGRNACKAKKGR